MNPTFTLADRLTLRKGFASVRVSGLGVLFCLLLCAAMFTGCRTVSEPRSQQAHFNAIESNGRDDLLGETSLASHNTSRLSQKDTASLDFNNTQNTASMKGLSCTARIQRKADATELVLTVINDTDQDHIVYEPKAGTLEIYRNNQLISAAVPGRIPQSIFLRINDRLEKTILLDLPQAQTSEGLTVRWQINQVAVIDCPLLTNY